MCDNYNPTGIREANVPSRLERWRSSFSFLFFPPLYSHISPSWMRQKQKAIKKQKNMCTPAAIKHAIFFPGLLLFLKSCQMHKSLMSIQVQWRVDAAKWWEADLPMLND